MSYEFERLRVTRRDAAYGAWLEALRQETLRLALPYQYHLS